MSSATNTPRSIIWTEQYVKMCLRCEWKQRHDFPPFELELSSMNFVLYNTFSETINVFLPFRLGNTLISFCSPGSYLPHFSSQSMFIYKGYTYEEKNPTVDDRGTCYVFKYKFILAESIFERTQTFSSLNPLHSGQVPAIIQDSWYCMWENAREVECRTNCCCNCPPQPLVTLGHIHVRTGGLDISWTSERMCRWCICPVAHSWQ